MIQEIDIEKANISSILFVQSKKQAFEVLLLCIGRIISLENEFFIEKNSDFFTWTRATNELTFSTIVSFFVSIKLVKACFKAAG